jgi:hypothetical protein
MTQIGWAGTSMAARTRAPGAAGFGKWAAPGRVRDASPARDEPAGAQPTRDQPSGAPGALWWVPVVVAAEACARASVGYWAASDADS